MMSAPDVGDCFEITTTWTYRKWQWLPFPWKRERTIKDTHSYRVTCWLKRRPPRPEPRDELERFAREFIDQLIARGADSPRGFGPDNVPLRFCAREEAEYVAGAGVAGIIVRVADVVVTGRVGWPEDKLEYARRHAERLAGEDLR